MFQVYAFYVIVAMAAAAFGAGYLRAWQVGHGSRRSLHSTPAYHGAWVLYCTSLPALVLLLICVAAQSTVIDWLIWRELPDEAKVTGNASLTIARLQNIANNKSMFGDAKDYEVTLAAYYKELKANAEYISGLAAIALAGALGAFSLASIQQSFKARNKSEFVVKGILWLASIVAILTTIGIVFSLITEALLFFSVVSPIDFFFGADWRPVTAIRSDQPGQEGSFGILPVLLGSFVIAIFAMFVAGPIGLFSAIYMVEFADPKLRAFAKPAIEFLAGIPTVVYGFFAAVTVAPLVRDLGNYIGFDASSESALAAGSVMGIMIIPFVSSLADDVISAVPARLRQAAYSLGANPRRNDHQGGASCSITRLAQCLCVGNQPRHWRDDDCCHGSGTCRQSDHEPV